MPRRPRRTLTPVTATARAPRITRGGGIGRVETWEARSRDGVWIYRREEDTGTTWAVQYVPSGQVLYCAATNLGDARAATADGSMRRRMVEEARRVANNDRLGDDYRAEARRWVCHYANEDSATSSAAAS